MGRTAKSENPVRRHHHKAGAGMKNHLKSVTTLETMSTPLRPLPLRASARTFPDENIRVFAGLLEGDKLPDDEAVDFREVQ